VCFIVTWQHISPEVTVKVFKKSCISNAMGGTKDNMLWNDEEVRDVGSECKEGKGTDCADGDSDTDW